MKSRTRLVFMFLLGCIAIIVLAYLGLSWQNAHGTNWRFIDLRVNWDIRARAIGFLPERDDGILIHHPTVTWSLILGQLYILCWIPASGTS